jgi:superfamily I DNA/RNA helicase
MKPTLPQQTVLDTIFQDLNQNFVVQGVPGAGKTTLISMVANRFLELGVTDILALTFSRSLAEDMGKKVTNGVTKTAHAYMYDALRKHLKLHHQQVSKGQLVRQPDSTSRYSNADDSLLQKISYALVRTNFGLIDKSKVPTEISKEFYAQHYGLIGCVNAIRTAGLNYTTEALKIHEKFDSKFGVQTVNDALVVLKTLTDRYFLRGTVDFMGMLYLPLIHPEVHNDIYSPQILILDEINDNTPLLENAYRIISRKSRQVIAVGDKKQTIHIWAGAKANGFETLADYFQAKMLTYDFTFRVPKAMCRYLNNSGLDTRIKPYAGNIEGAIIESLSYHDFLNKVYHGDMVLCRYNRGNRVLHTLQKVSIDLLLKRKRVAFRGSTHIEDIQELFILSQPILKSQAATKKAFKDHVSKSVANAIAQEYTDKDLTKDNYRCEMLREKLESFVLYFDFFCATQVFMDVQKFIPFLEKMYVDTDDAIQIMSGHRCKGLETESKAFILHFEEMVNTANDTTADMSVRVEAHNLALVMLTRSKNITYIVEGTLPQYFPEPKA